MDWSRIKFLIVYNIIEPLIEIGLIFSIICLIKILV